MNQFECIVECAIKSLTNEEILDLEPYADQDYSYTTWKEAKRMIVEDVMDKVWPIVEFKGECANEYKSMYDYLTSGGFERDYFASWLKSCSDYPCLDEITEFCDDASEMIQLWVHLHKLGLFEWREETWNAKE
jgi:hypothetical protein